MTTSRPVLILDDPLDGRQPTPSPAMASPAPTTPRRARPQRSSRPATVPAASEPAPTEPPSLLVAEPPAATDAPADEEWRDWAGPKRVASYRLPDELLEELTTTSEQLGIPIGHLVIAGLTHLLDETPAEITTLADRAAQTLVRGKRNARRKKARERAAGE